MATKRLDSESRSLLVKADWLMARYAPPETPLFKKFSPVMDRHFEALRPRKINWYIGGGLTTLLHEIGHAVLRHHNTEAPWRSKIIEEAEAWLWAEKTARKEHIQFDYAAASKWFGTYFSASKRRQLVNINWRWKP